MHTLLSGISFSCLKITVMGLRILIIGAGLGGLAAAISIKFENPEHNVVVIESAPELAEVCLLTESDLTCTT